MEWYFGRHYRRLWRRTRSFDQSRSISFLIHNIRTTSTHFTSYSIAMVNISAVRNWNLRVAAGRRNGLVGNT
jgi:hypothetical protein